MKKAGALLSREGGELGEAKKSGRRPLSKDLLYLTIMFAGLSLIMCPLNRPLVNFLLFHPAGKVVINQDAFDKIEESLHARWSEVSFPSRNGMNLHAWYFKLPKPKRTFLVSHGNGGNLSHRLNVVVPILKSGCDVFLYDYQGYGKSGGTPDDRSIVEDGIAAYDFLVEKEHVGPADVVLYGESLGCAVTTQIMQKREAAGIVLQSCFASLTGAARDKFFWTAIYPDAMFPQRHLENLEAYREKHPPLLVLHGARDWILPAKYGQKVYHNAIEPKKLVIMPNCGHNDFFLKDLESGYKALSDFVDSLE